MARSSVYSEFGFNVLKVALGRHAAKNNFLVRKYKELLKESEDLSQEYPEQVLKCEIYRCIIRDLESPVDAYFLTNERF